MTTFIENIYNNIEGQRQRHFLIHTTGEPCNSGPPREQITEWTARIEMHQSELLKNIRSHITSRPHRLKKTSSMQSKRRDLHYTWLHRETNEKLSFYKFYKCSRRLFFVNARSNKHTFLAMCISVGWGKWRRIESRQIHSVCCQSSPLGAKFHHIHCKEKKINYNLNFRKM